MLSETNRRQLQALSKSSYWGALVALQRELLEKWYRELGPGTDEFAYLRSNLLRDGKIEGVTAFLQSIEQTNQ